MYTNELLEEKYKAQKQLEETARKENKSYLHVVEEEAKELYKQKGWELNFVTPALHSKQKKFGNNP